MLVFCGDIHGKFTDLINKLSPISKASVIACGDIGLGFDSILEDTKNLLALNQVCKEKEIIINLIRGNHDNPAIWELNWKLSNVWFIKDYLILNIDNKKILFIGGAQSIDKKYRTEGVSWWAGEDIRKFVPTNDKIDIVASHDCPTAVMSYGRGHSTLSQVFKHYLPKVWYFGHHHESINTSLIGCKFVGLNELELKEHL